jgi:GNAT superfamily N-acetyltransferase
MKEYQRQGIGGRMLGWVETEADARGWTVEAVVRPVYREMAALLQERGYERKLDAFLRK